MTPPPDTDVLATVLALVIASNRNAEQICEETGFEWDDVQAAIASLTQRGVIRNIGFEHYHASQTRCAGSCLRDGREVRGQEVVINPQTFRWTCADCSEAVVERAPETEGSGGESDPDEPT